MPELQALTERVPLAEAAGGQTPRGRRFRARIIQGDIQGSCGFYPAEMLKRDASVFREGLPVFLDHPGATESYDRPERSVRDLAGKLASTAVYERDGLYADVEVYPHWAPVVEAMAGDIGMSIRSSGTVEPSLDEAIRGPIVTALTEAYSVDFVTAAGAGGKVVALLESARSQAGDLLRKAVDTRAIPKSAAETQDERLTEARAQAEEVRAGVASFIEGFGRDDDAPVQLAEARNVGAWLESRIHSVFTQLADDMYGDGRLTREERITCSGAIGDALKAFTARVEADAGHLYQRDLWDDPEPAPAEVSETAAPLNVPAPPDTSIKEGAPMSEGTDKQGTPPDGGTTEVAESAVHAELTEARRQLAEARLQIVTIGENAQRATLAEADRDRYKADNDRLRAVIHAQDRLRTTLSESGLPEVSHARVTAVVCGVEGSNIPLTEAGKVDEESFTSAIAAAIQAEKTYIAGLAEAAGTGVPRGLGGSSEGEPLSESAFDEQMERVFAGIGMSDEVAKAAAKGRVNL